MVKPNEAIKSPKRGGAKGVLEEGKGAYFKPPEELSDLKPFFEEDTVSKWAAWRLQGYEQFGKKKDVALTAPLAIPKRQRSSIRCLPIALTKPALKLRRQ